MNEKSRRVNYASEERRLLTELVEKYKNVIENKETNAGSNLQKDKTWKVIEKLFNSKNINVYRDASSLRKQWAHIKMETRKKTALERQEMYKTGGGTLNNNHCSSTSNNNDDLVLSIVNNKIVSGLENMYDFDAIVADPIQAEIVNSGETSNMNMTEVLNDIENIPSPTQEVHKKLEANEKVPRWSAKRRPQLEKIGPVEKAKIEVLHAQRDKIFQEIEMKKKLFDLEFEHKKKMFELEEAKLQS